MNLIVVYLVCYTCSCGHRANVATAVPESFSRAAVWEFWLFMLFVYVVLFIFEKWMNNFRWWRRWGGPDGSMAVLRLCKQHSQSLKLAQGPTLHHADNDISLTLYQVKYCYLALKCSINRNMNAEASTQPTKAKKNTRSTHFKRWGKIIYHKVCTHQTLITLPNT